MAFERHGFRTVAFSEIEPFPCRVLAHHWPNVPNLGDVRKVKGGVVIKRFGRIDCITGGFPCQDISVAGKGAGIDGERSGLWREFARLVGEVRPRFVLVENTAALLFRGLGRVLGDLSIIGYDAEWHVVPASAVGIPQRRHRVFIAAYPTRSSGHPLLHKDSFNVACNKKRKDGGGKKNAHLNNKNRRESTMSILANGAWPEIPHRERSGNNERLSVGMDRYRALGNSIVPQVAEIFAAEIDKYLRTHER